MFKINRFAVLLLCALLLNSAHASDPTYMCENCRGPVRHYVDYGNFAFNAVWGADPWIGIASDQATYTQPLLIQNLNGHIVEVFFIDITNLFPLPGNTMTIRVVKPDGEVIDYNILATSVGSNLPVGRPGVQWRSGRPGGGGGGGWRPSTPSLAGGGRTGIPPTPICGISRVDGKSPRRTCQ